MTPEGNFDALLRILDGREQERLTVAAAVDEARKAEIAAAVTLGILIGTIGTVIGTCLFVWIFA